MMKRLMIIVFASVALVAAAIATRQHPPTGLSAQISAMSHTTADANKLPVEDFEDMTLVYSRRTHDQTHDGAGDRRLTVGSSQQR